MRYDYERLRSDAETLRDKHSSFERLSAGESVMGRELLYFKTGCGEKKLLLCGAFHGLEYLTAAFLMKFLDELLSRAEENADFFGYGAAELLGRVTLFVLPMVNPDGVDIAVNGIDLDNSFHRELIRDVGVLGFDREWQANARGVDINHNFNARWKRLAERPAPTKHGGPYPESEPETRAVIDLVRSERFDMLAAFHSQGGEIYYDFHGQTGPRSLELARKMAAASGYKVRRPLGTASFGGCKDWFIQEYRREGFTIEMGRGTNPLPLEYLNGIYDENARLVLCLMNEM